MKRAAKTASVTLMEVSRRILREIVEPNGIIHEVWVKRLPAAWEPGGRCPNYKRKGKKGIRNRTQQKQG